MGILGFGSPGSTRVRHVARVAREHYCEAGGEVLYLGHGGFDSFSYHSGLGARMILDQR